jgi:hypothetical protein
MIFDGLHHEPLSLPPLPNILARGPSGFAPRAARLPHPTQQRGALRRKHLSHFESTSETPFRFAQRPKLTDLARGTRRLQPRRSCRVLCSAWLARSCAKSLCILLQETYLMGCLDGRSLDCPNSLNRCRSALAPRNQIRSQQRARPTKPSLAVNSHRSLGGALRLNKANKLLCLLKRRWAAVGDWQTKKAETCRLVNGSITRNVQKRHDYAHTSGAQSWQLILERGQCTTAGHAAVRVDKRHRHTCQDAGNHPPQKTAWLWPVHSGACDAT